MRPITTSSLRGIAWGVLLSAGLTSTGCYHSMGQPGYGYGSPMYGNQYPGYGGYQGIQTLTPGNYYAPGSTTPTYNSNGLNPIADPNAGGAGSGGAGGGSGGGNDAPPYSPGVGSDPSRPVPMYDGAGSDSSAPAEDPAAQPQLNQFDSGSPSTLSKPEASGDWAIQPASGRERTEAEAEPVESLESTVAEPGLETAEQTEGTEEEPPLLAPVAE